MTLAPVAAWGAGRGSATAYASRGLTMTTDTTRPTQIALREDGELCYPLDHGEMPYE